MGLTGPDVGVEDGGVSLGTGLAASVTATVGAAAGGLCLSGKADKPGGKVRALAVFCFFVWATVLDLWSIRVLL